MIRVNLLPDIKKEYLKTLRLKTQVIIGSIIAMILSVGLVVMFALSVYVVQVQLINLSLNPSIDDKAKELRQKPTLNRDLTIQNQLSALPELHTDKSRYSVLMDMLPVLNPAPPNSVSLSGLQLADENQSISLNGRTASFEALSAFRDSLRFADVSYISGDSTEPTKDKLFTSVVIESSGLAEEQGTAFVAFTIRTTFNKGAFAESSREVKVSIPNIQTSSQADLSRNLFTEGQ